MKDVDKVIDILTDRIKQLESELSLEKWKNEGLHNENADLIRKLNQIEKRPAMAKAEETR